MLAVVVRKLVAEDQAMYLLRFSNRIPMQSPCTTLISLSSSQTWGETSKKGVVAIIEKVVSYLAKNTWQTLVKVLNSTRLHKAFVCRAIVERAVILRKKTTRFSLLKCRTNVCGNSARTIRAWWKSQCHRKPNLKYNKRLSILSKQS